MAQITIPDELLDQVVRVAPSSASTEQFVADAVRDKLAFNARRAEFYRLSDETRRRMEAAGILEEDILSEFDAQRKGMNGG